MSCTSLELGDPKTNKRDVVLVFKDVIVSGHTTVDNRQWEGSVLPCSSQAEPQSKQTRPSLHSE